jgi:broad specificity phosphatase PhoE
MARTTVHLLRHGEVHNPGHVLYGRLPDFHLSAAGRGMAERVAKKLIDRDITYLVASPLERAQETAAPLAAALSLEIHTDQRLIEAGNEFEGQLIGPGKAGSQLFLRPSTWPKLRNPFRPSWGEPYSEIAARMWAATQAARDAAEGHEAVCVSHQLPIWTLRRWLAGERLWHDPRRRECALASLTSVEFDGDKVAVVTYTEPAGPDPDDAVPGA